MAENSLFKIAIDQQEHTLVEFQGSVPNLDRLYAGEKKTFQVQLVNPPISRFGNSATPTIVTMSGRTLDISVSATPSGTNTVTPVAQVTGIAWDSTNQWHLGVLDLSPAGVLSLIGTGATVTAYIEFRFWNGLDPVFTFQKTFTLYAPIDKGSTGTAPVPATNYYNQQQADGKFVTWEVPAGFALTFLTSDPKKKLALRVGDDLAPIWEIISLP